jgi:LysR family transcriptional regulator, glycine cleavage system transcriptional activator
MREIDWMHYPPLSALRALEATARCGGFSGAASTLNVTHAAVSQQVRNLESYLGLALVRRDGRNVALTDEGARLARAAAEGFLTIQSATHILLASRNPNALTITITRIFAEKWLMPRLKQFWAQYPEISVTLKPEDRLVDLRQEAVDIGIRFGDGKWPGIDATFLTSARFVVVAAPALIDGIGPLSAAKMVTLPWINESECAEMASWLQSHGIDGTALKTKTLPTEELALSAAREGYGLYLTSAPLVEQDLRDGLLRIVFDPQDDIQGYFIATPSGLQNPTARLFIKWLTQAV